MLRSSVRSLLCLLAAFAVLLGALEHEDLILQDSPASTVASVEDLSVGDTDSGTEGTFRFHLPRLWLSPPAAAWTPLRASFEKPATHPAAIYDRRLALAGHVALRL